MNVDFALLKESMADLGMFHGGFFCYVIIEDAQSRHMVRSPNVTSSRAWA
jgi:hypothetical protein